MGKSGSKGRIFFMLSHEATVNCTKTYHKIYFDGGTDFPAFI